MGNFSDFLNNKRHKGQDDISSKNNSEKKTYTNEDLESMINKYSSFSQDKLMSEFIKLTLEKKRKGELNESSKSKLWYAKNKAF